MHMYARTCTRAPCLVPSLQAPLVHSFHLPGGPEAPWDWQQLHREQDFSDMVTVPLHCGGASMLGALTLAFWR